ncbi:hypothetical protein D3C78_1393150 [compost metagenome]
MAGSLEHVAIARCCCAGAGRHVSGTADVRFLRDSATAGNAVGVSPSVVLQLAAGFDMPRSESMASAVRLGEVRQ